MLGAAPILYTLYANHLRIDPKNPSWIDRDRFVMSPGHGSALLYATLFMAGYDIKLEDLVRYGQVGTNTPIMPMYGKTPGVEYSTGLSGEGFAASVGMAIAEKYLISNMEKNIKNQRVYSHKIYCLVSDGDLEEGITYEAASIAGNLGLSNLIVLYDSNSSTFDGNLSKTSNENMVKRFDSLNWNIDYVKDGNNVVEIDKAINRAKKNKNRPTIIEIKTTVGQDSFNAGTNIVHQGPLSKDDIINLHQKYNINTSKFEITTKYLDLFRKMIDNRMKGELKHYVDYLKTFHNTNYPEIQLYDRFFNEGQLNINFDAKNFKIQANYMEDLRESNYKIMNIIADRTPFFLGGSADNVASTKTNLIKHPDFSKENYAGKNIYFGVREQAMGAIVNGIATYNLRPFASTYLAYSDYLKPFIRTASMMKIPATYVFTHDGLSASFDGASHQAIEQIATLRSIPNHFVYRPGDINEVIGSWDAILKNGATSSIIITTNNTHILGGTNSLMVGNGAYVVKQERERLDAIIVTSGSDLTTSLLVADDLKSQYDIRVVSCPCQELFFMQSQEYIESIIPKGIKVICIEASTKNNWVRFTNYDNIIGIDTFGVGGRLDDVLNTMNFTREKIKEKVIELLK